MYRTVGPRAITGDSSMIPCYVLVHQGLTTYFACALQEYDGRIGVDFQESQHAWEVESGGYGTARILSIVVWLKVM